MPPNRSKPKTTAKLREVLGLTRVELLAHPEDHPQLKKIAADLRAARGVLALSLIERARLACQDGKLPPEFTPAQFKEWIQREGITKPNGEPYAESSVNALLSNSDVANTGSSNLNKKVLKSFMKDGRKHFSFI
jgi:hypothetical protein